MIKNTEFSFKINDICLFSHLKAKLTPYQHNITKIMIFGKLASDLDVLACLQINSTEIEFVRSYRYLGFHVISDSHFKFSSSECLRGFYGAVNSVLSVLRRPRENVLMQLLYSNCVPKLTYGAAVKDLTAAQKYQYNVAVNNAVRRIF